MPALFEVKELRAIHCTLLMAVLIVIPRLLIMRPCIRAMGHLCKCRGPSRRTTRRAAWSEIQPYTYHMSLTNPGLSTCAEEVAIGFTDSFKCLAAEIFAEPLVRPLKTESRVNYLLRLSSTYHGQLGKGKKK